MKTPNRSLEGLRGAAALIVVLYHLGQVAHLPGVIRSGYLAVDLFFVLSGLVICSSYDERLRSGWSEVWRFLVRRIGRLWPLHITTAILFYVVGGLPLILTHSGLFAPTGAEALSIVTLTQGMNFFDHAIGNPNAWSTGDEFYVYLLFAGVCLLARRQVQIGLACGLVVAGLAVTIYIDAGACRYNGHCMDLGFTFGWARCIAGFSLGCLIAHFRTRLLPVATPTVQVITAIVALSLMIGAYVIPLSAFAAPFVFAMVIVSLISDRGPLASLLQTRPLQYLGRVSYSLYLSHAVFVMPLAEMLWLGKYGISYQLAGTIVFLLCALCMTQFLHRYIEVPFRDRIYAWADSRTQHFVSPTPLDCREERGCQAGASTR
ncbi:acyltransferase family protein [Paraburkholderia silvatlantica]|uniref:acyltransferase family protein n=1 Tax=Paraburkholderia silvatlantica TaxID=321895 RepID=UPI00375224F7